jgi:hypothetical protein
MFQLANKFPRTQSKKSTAARQVLLASGIWIPQPDDKMDCYSRKSESTCCWPLLGTHESITLPCMWDKQASLVDMIPKPTELTFGA